MNFSAATTLTATDWDRWIGRNTAVRDGGLSLASEPALTVDRLSLSARDIAVDADGTLYTLRSSGAVVRHDRQRGIEHRLWDASSHDTDDTSDPRAICVSGNRLYVVDETGLLTIISTRLQQPIGTIETGLAEPTTITAAGGRLYLLGYQSESVYLLQPDGSTEAVFESLSAPIDLTVDEQGAIYVLEAPDDQREIHKQAATGELLDGTVLVGRNRRIRKRTPDGDVDPARFPLSTVETNDGASIQPTRIGTTEGSPLLVAGRTAADDLAVVAVDPERSTVRERTRLDGPCRVFRTPSGADGTSYAVVGDANSCLRLEPTETHQRGPADERYCGRAYRQFDAGESIQWHRLTVDADRSQSTASTRLTVSYLASDDPSPIEEPLWNLTGLDESLVVEHVDTVWDLLSYNADELAALSEELTTAEARDCLETALEALETALSGQWQTAESTDVLLSEATGRYLTVRLELIGSPTAGPRITALRAFWPRQSSLQYLPELYRDDAESAAFLEQLLSVFDTLFTDIEQQADSITQYFDPAAVPAESLPWLAEWIGLDVPADWPTAAIRERLTAAPDRYTKRGTRDGLRELLGIYLRHLSPPETPPANWMIPDESTASGTDALAGVNHGLCILEPQDVDAIDSAAAKDAYQTHLDGPRSVAVYAGPFDDPDQRAAVEAIIHEETPAHVRGSLVELDSEFTLGADSFLGSNTRLSERHMELGEAALGTNATLD